jgi:NAD-dependent SIR2 family protein deacetylase
MKEVECSECGDLVDPLSCFSHDEWDSGVQVHVCEQCQENVFENGWHSFDDDFTDPDLEDIIKDLGDGL